MNQPLYDATFYRGEIARLSLDLTQALSDVDRATTLRHLDAAKAHLAELSGIPLPLKS